MADSSLDDFFAKKDKSKRIKKKALTPEEIAKKLEESGKESVGKSKKDKEKPPSSAVVNLKILEQDDEEWKDFEDERERDYSGLRIQALNIKDKEEELREQKLQENGAENKRDEASGPWKIKPPSPVPGDEDEEAEGPVKEEPTTVAPPPSSDSNPTKYVPPHLRNKPASSSLSTSSPAKLEPWRGNRKLKNAPEINNEFEFPSLGTAVEAQVDTKDFTSVKHGQRDVTRTAVQPLDTENKYNVLGSSRRLMEDED